MKRRTFYLIFIYLFSCTATSTTTHITQTNNAQENIKLEINEFFRSYAEDLRQGRRESIAERYDTGGYYRMGNGNKTFVSFADSKKRYLTNWTGPKSFEWKDLSIEVISPEAVLVTALYDWQIATGEKATFSYTGLLTKKSGQWRLRVEDESFNSLGYTTKTISGNRSVAGAVKYILTAQPGASVSAHFHSGEMHIKVVSGRKFIIMGDLDSARVQRFDAGSSFVIPANTWHLEWWEEETVEEIDIMAPWKTERATSATPRKSK
jgi:quercetin dioxygenase-like cupin family protein